MFKKALLVSVLAMSSSVMADVKVNVENDSKIYSIELNSKDEQASIYSTDPLNTLTPNSNDGFFVFSTYPDLLNIVSLEYRFEERRSPTCHFRFTIIKDSRSGKWLPQAVISDDEGGSFRDKAICSGKIDSFDIDTGSAEVTFSMNRRKY